MAEPTVDQSSARSTTPDSCVVSSIARAMLGDAANEYNEKSFVRGYKKGFDTGWRAAFKQGIEIGKKLGRFEAEAELKNCEGSENSKSQLCLLSDVALGENTSDTSSIRDEDVFYDAQSEISDSLALFNDSSSYNAASIDSPENSTNTSAGTAASEAGASTSTAPAISETNVKTSTNPEVVPAISGANVKASASPSAASTASKASINTSIPAKSETNISTPAVTITNENGTTKVAPEEEEEDLLDLFYDADSPLPATTPSPPDTLYNIPLAHTITPIIPDFTKTPSFYRPRPAYPTLSGRYDVYAGAAQGAKIVDDPYRVLIGPLSPAARQEWRADCGRAYLRNKLGRTTSTGGGWGGGGKDRGGVVLCQMVRDDAGVWYVLAMFENQERAGAAVEFLHGFACGGSIMWAWIYREEE